MDRGKRHVLFLQGSGTLFFSHLAEKLSRDDIEISKIQLCYGDELLWRNGNATRYRGKFADWRNYLADYLVENGVSDIVLFSDTRAYHWIAARIASHMNINVFVFENGYLRPDWITMELGGVNGRSPFPRDKASIEALAETNDNIDAESSQIKYSNYHLYGDIVFHAVNFLTTPLYLNYRRFRSPHPLQELWGWAKKGLSWKLRVKQSKSRLERLLASGKSYFFYPLQLEHDYQLIVDSSFESVTSGTENIIKSFAKNAPSDTTLLIKNHPRDNNIINRKVDIKRLAKKYNITKRVVYIEAGNNPQILQKAKGMVTINSTMGPSGLLHELPVCVLGAAIYDIDGLTHKLGLDNFWTNPTKPDMKFFRTFRQTLIEKCLIRGEFGNQNPDSKSIHACAERIKRTQYHCANQTIVERNNYLVSTRPDSVAKEADNTQQEEQVV